MHQYINFKLFHEISAGGIVFKKVNGRIRFAVIERNALKDWTLPKGHQRGKETLQQTARREVFEETGFHCAILDYLDSFTYQNKNDERKIVLIKTVHWFLMKYLNGYKRKQNKEIKRVKWLTMADALKIISYHNDQRMLKKAASLIDK